MLAIDLFSGAGGMSAGASLSCIETISAVEIDKNSAATYSYNHPNTNVIQRDIRKVNADDLKDNLGRKINIVFGGPPCQGFSTSNQKTRNSNNSANWLFGEYVRLVAEIEPDWVVFENVKGLAETEKGHFLKLITDSFSKIGFNVSTMTLNAAHYGVPQRRERLFIICSRSGKKLSEPPTAYNQLYTVKDALADLPSLRSGADEDFLSYGTAAESTYAKSLRGDLKGCYNHLVTNNRSFVLDRYSHIPQGGNWEDIPESLMLNYTDRTRCHSGIYYRLIEDCQSIVVGNYRKNMLVHPWENRGLSVREAARLQSFPDNYRFFGSIGFQQQQVGNAVPPLLAKSVFSAILNQV